MKQAKHRANKAIAPIPAATKQTLNLLAELFVLARKQRGWRQFDLAERLGISRQTVARIERGDPKVSVGTYFACAWILDVPIFQGMEMRDARSNNVLASLIAFLKDKLPERSSGKREKPVDDNF